MKRLINIIGTIINIILTFVIAEIFSLYHFLDIPNFLTIIYLVSIFIILEYLFLSLVYIIKNKGKISKYKIGSLILFFISIIFILGFIFLVDIDFLNYYSYINSAPFYVFILSDIFKMIVPSIIVSIIGILLLKKDKNK